MSETRILVADDSEEGRVAILRLLETLDAVVLPVAVAVCIGLLGVPSTIPVRVSERLPGVVLAIPVSIGIGLFRVPRPIRGGVRKRLCDVILTIPVGICVGLVRECELKLEAAGLRPARSRHIDLAFIAGVP